MGKLGITTAYEDVENLSVGEILERSSKIAPEKIAVMFKKDHVTYKLLNELSDTLAVILQQEGIKKGDRASIYMHNCIELYVVFYALQKIGAVVAWVSPAYRTQELMFILSNSQAKAIFIHKEKNNFYYLGFV